ncbi:Gp37 family protein [Burkholderia cepacia]|uniref:Gp37 family protein n=1 Tax=Burkholderia cepacia TaxID=292 RepID=UPI0026DEA7F1|nr:Gp37 family protein [Burkholderia cepacia]MDO5940638.1 Gp37 family protein [Burkholderia cepacia]
MATTLQIIDALVQRLKVKLPQLAVEYFPDKPAEYRLNHPKGALLVSYLGSKFDPTVDVTYIAQPRTVKLSVTVILRQLHGRGGAVDVVDDVRRALIGWRPPDCRKVWAVSDKFLGETAGLWQYAVDLASESMLVEDADVNTETPLTQVTYEEQP